MIEYNDFYTFYIMNYVFCIMISVKEIINESSLF